MLLGDPPLLPPLLLVLLQAEDHRVLLPQVSERVIAMFLVYPPMDNDYASASYIGNHSSSHPFDDSLMTMHYDEGSHLLFLYPMYSMFSLPNAHHIWIL